MSYWTHSIAFQAGTLVRADEMNSKLDGIETGFATAEAEIVKTIRLNADTTTAIPQNAASRASMVIGFDGAGNVDLKAGFGQWKGDHADGVSTPYYERDIVVDAAGRIGLDNIYICNTAHTSSDTILAETANWDILIDVVDIETKRADAENSKTLASQWASLTSGLVEATDYSSKAYAIGGTGVTGAAGAAKEWATLITGAVDGSSFSSKAYAVGGTGVTGSIGAAKEWATLITGAVDGGSEYSAKAYAIGGTGVTGTIGAAKEWAVLITGAVDGSSFSSKAYAVGGTGVTGTIGASKEWATLVSGKVDGSGYSAQAWAEGATGMGTTEASAKDWADKAEDSAVITSPSNKYSAFHWSEKAAAWAAGLSLPAITVPDAKKMLKINDAGTAYELTAFTHDEVVRLDQTNVFDTALAIPIEAPSVTGELRFDDEMTDGRYLKHIGWNNGYNFRIGSNVDVVTDTTDRYISDFGPAQIAFSGDNTSDDGKIELMQADQGTDTVAITWKNALTIYTLGVKVNCDFWSSDNTKTLGLTGSRWGGLYLEDNAGIYGRFHIIGIPEFEKVVQFSINDWGVASTHSIDWAADSFLNKIEVSGVSLTFNASLNVEAGMTLEFLIECTSGGAGYTFPSGWTFVGLKPFGINGGKKGVLSLRSFGVNDSSVIASYSEQT